MKTAAIVVAVLVVAALSFNPLAWLIMKIVTRLAY